MNMRINTLVTGIVPPHTPQARPPGSPARSIRTPASQRVHHGSRPFNGAKGTSSLPSAPRKFSRSAAAKPREMISSLVSSAAEGLAASSAGRCWWPRAQQFSECPPTGPRWPPGGSRPAPHPRPTSNRITRSRSTGHALVGLDRGGEVSGGFCSFATGARRAGLERGRVHHPDGPPECVLRWSSVRCRAKPEAAARRLASGGGQPETWAGGGVRDAGQVSGTCFGWGWGWGCAAEPFVAALDLFEKGWVVSGAGRGVDDGA